MKSERQVFMKIKYDSNDLLDFLVKNPMEMREFMDAHEKLNPFIKFWTKFLSRFY
jgi:hypothetical protein